MKMEEVRSALQAEEPDYAKLADRLGLDALPHLYGLVVGGEDPLTSAKATYLAAVIGGELAAPVVSDAASSAYPSVRVAAAAAAAWLPEELASDVLLPLVDDVDLGVQKVALRAVPERPSARLYRRVEALSAKPAHKIIGEASRAAIDRVTRAKQ